MYTLYDPEDLPGLFRFIEAAPIEVPNWLRYIQGPNRRNRYRGRNQRQNDRPGLLDDPPVAAPPIEGDAEAP